MKLVFTPEAESQAAAMDTWWREHRPGARGLVIIHAIWGAPRGRGPEL